MLKVRGQIDRVTPNKCSLSFFETIDVCPFLLIKKVSINFMPLPGDVLVAKAVKNNIENAKFALNITAVKLEKRSYEKITNPFDKLFVLLSTLAYYRKSLIDLASFNEAMRVLKKREVDTEIVSSAPSSEIEFNGIKKLISHLSFVAENRSPDASNVLALNTFFERKNGKLWLKIRYLVSKIPGLQELFPVTDTIEFGNYHVASDLTDFAKNSGAIRIYIDEVWFPESSQSIIAGIIWSSGKIDKSSLSERDNHSNSNERLRYDPVKLLACPKAFPFIIKYSENDYLSIVSKSLKILLGWVLPQNGPACEVSVFLEALEGDGGRFAAGKYWTDFFKGVVREAANSSKKRFSRWLIKEVKCVPKDFEYIGWADLLGYIGSARTPDTKSYFEYHCLSKWQGYIAEGTALLEDLIKLDYDSIRASRLLSFIETYQKQGFVSLILKNFEEQLKNDQVLQTNVLKALEQKFREKGRNLGSLRRIVELLNGLSENFFEGASLSARFAWIGVSLKNANHHGNAHLAAHLAESYSEIRHLVLENDRELVCNTDLALVVHYNDSFEFDKARQLNQSLADDPAFVYHSLLLRAKIKSSLGQSLSIAGEYLSSEKLFLEAINLFEQADLPQSLREAEILQTSVYRCINAFDGSLPVKREIFEGIFCPSSDVKSKVDEGWLPACPYALHCLLRVIYWSKDYPDIFVDPKRLHDIGAHPWELIWLYAGLINARVDGNSKKFTELISKSINLCSLKHHGSTIKLIGLIVFSVHKCMTDAKFNRAAIAGFSNKLKAELPAASAIIDNTLNTLEKAAEPSSIQSLLKQMPFNYR